MEQKLDHFRPTPETLANIRRQLVNAGIQQESIPEEWLMAIVAATTKWAFRTPSGLEFSLQWLGAKRQKGSEEKEYEFMDVPAQVIYQIPADKILFFTGAAIHGNPVDPENILAIQKGKQQCDSCGISEHCIREVRDPIRDRMESLCNTCLSLNGRMAESAKSCSDCPIVHCYHHPKNSSLGKRVVG